MEKHARLQTAAKTAAPWLLEGIFIVVSVLLGFAATQSVSAVRTESSHAAR